MTPFDGIDNSSRMWILKNTPGLWDMDESEAFLTNAGFTDVVWYSKQMEGCFLDFPRQKNGFWDLFATFVRWWFFRIWEISLWTL